MQLQMLVFRPRQERQSGAPLCSSLLLQMGCSLSSEASAGQQGGREGREESSPDQSPPVLFFLSGGT